MMDLKTDFPPLQSCRAALGLAAITIALQACGGGGSGGDADPVDMDPPVAGIPDNDPVAGEPEDGSTVETVTDPDLLAGDVPRDQALADVAGSDFYPNSNNSAIVSGAVIGDGSIDNALLSRSVPFEVESLPATLKVEHVYAVRTRHSDDDTKIIAIVRNVSADAQCFVVSEDMTVLDQAGGTVEASLGFATVIGTTYSTSLGLVTSTCMDPQQLAYLENDFRVELTDVQAVNAGIFEATLADSYDRLERSLTPISYEVLADGNMEVMVVNQGLSTVESSVATVVFLDSDGYPLDVETALPYGDLAPGAEATFIVDTEDFEGSATSARVFVD